MHSWRPMRSIIINRVRVRRDSLILIGFSRHAHTHRVLAKYKAFLAEVKGNPDPAQEATAKALDILRSKLIGHRWAQVNPKIDFWLVSKLPSSLMSLRAPQGLYITVRQPKSGSYLSIEDPDFLLILILNVPISNLLAGYEAFGEVLCSNDPLRPLPLYLMCPPCLP